MNFSSILGKIYNFWNIVIFENTLRRIFFAIAVFVILLFVARFLVKRLKKRLENTEWKRYESILWAVAKLPSVFWLFVVLFIVSKILVLPLKAVSVINAIFLLIVIFWAARIIVKLSSYVFWKALHGNPAWKKAAELIVNIVVWALWILLFLSNIWVNLTPLVASLWVASIAVAFALQNILADLFASFSILFSKIYVIWDFIEIGDISWTVKNITLKCTTLTNVFWQDVIIPNNMALTHSIVNYWKSKYRWQRVTIWVTYSTSIKYLKEIPEIVKNVITKVEDTEFERCYFKKMNDYSLDFLISYKCLSPDYKRMLEINEKINLWLFEEFGKKWIEFAFPSQTIYSYNLDDKAKEKSWIK